MPDSERMQSQDLSYSTSRDELVMFGDSITQFAWQKGGIGSELANFYQRRLDLVNRGYSGYNTTWALHVAKTVFPTEFVESRQIKKKRIVTIWLGANDAVLPPKPQSVEIPQFKENLNKLIDIIEAHDQRTTWTNGGQKTLIMLITPPPISISMRAADCAARFPDWKPENMDRDPIRSRQFAESVCQVAKERGLPVIDCWTSITKAAGDVEGLSRYLCDGLHLTSDGYELVTQEFKSIISRHYPHLCPENLPHDFPWWTDIDFVHPENSFPGTS